MRTLVKETLGRSLTNALAADIAQARETLKEKAECTTASESASTRAPATEPGLNYSAATKPPETSAESGPQDRRPETELGDLGEFVRVVSAPARHRPHAG
jgi:hypothetical protein